MEETRAKPGRKSSWTDTQDSFRSLLYWLDNGEDSEGRSYIEMRRRLVLFFDRKNCSAPELLADETLSRVSRRLQEEGTITGESPARYCYITAKFVFLEYTRNAGSRAISLDDISKSNGRVSNIAEVSVENELKERMLDCLEECALSLDASARDLIFDYYSGNSAEKIENRRKITEKMGISPNALAIKAYRIRLKLEACVSKCAGLK